MIRVEQAQFCKKHSCREFNSFSIMPLLHLVSASTQCHAIVTPCLSFHSVSCHCYTLSHLPLSVMPLLHVVSASTKCHAIVTRCLSFHSVSCLSYTLSQLSLSVVPLLHLLSSSTQCDASVTP